jgi:hypothetical protein
MTREDDAGAPLAHRGTASKLQISHQVTNRLKDRGSTRVIQVSA